MGVHSRPDNDEEVKHFPKSTQPYRGKSYGQNNRYAGRYRGIFFNAHPSHKRDLHTMDGVFPALSGDEQDYGPEEDDILDADGNVTGNVFDEMLDDTTQ